MNRKTSISIDLRLLHVDKEDQELELCSLKTGIKFLYKQESFDKFKDVSNLANLLAEIKNDNISNLIQNIENTRFPYTKNGVRVILEQIFIAAGLNPNKVINYYELYLGLLNKASSANCLHRFNQLTNKIFVELTIYSMHLILSKLSYE